MDKNNNVIKTKKAAKPNKQTKRQDELSPKTIMIFRVFIIVALLATFVAIGLIIYESFFKKDEESNNPYEDYYVLNHEEVTADLGIILDIQAGTSKLPENIANDDLRTIIEAFVVDQDKSVYLFIYRSSTLNENLKEKILANEALKKQETADEDKDKDFVFLLIDLDNNLLSGFDLNNIFDIDGNYHAGTLPMLLEIHYVGEITTQKTFTQDSSTITSIIEGIA